MHGCFIKQSLFRRPFWLLFHLGHVIAFITSRVLIRLQPPSVVVLVVEIWPIFCLHVQPPFEINLHSKKAPFCGAFVAAPFFWRLWWSVMFNKQLGRRNKSISGGPNPPPQGRSYATSPCRNVWNWMVMEDMCHEAPRAPHPTMLFGHSFTNKQLIFILHPFCVFFLHSFVDVFLFFFF